MLVPDAAMLGDHRLDRGGGAPKDTIALIISGAADPAKEAVNIATRSIAKLPGDERAVGVAGAGAPDRTGAGVAQATA
jgi:hypothetical protein